MFLMDVFETGPSYKGILNKSSYHLDLNSYAFFGTSIPSSQHRIYVLELQKPNSVADTETLIAMINGDRFAAAKQYLVNVLPLLKAAELPGGGRMITCNNCGAGEFSIHDEISFYMNEAAWSNCAGCVWQW